MYHTIEIHPNTPDNTMYAAAEIVSSSRLEWCTCEESMLDTMRYTSSALPRVRAGSNMHTNGNTLKNSEISSVLHTYSHLQMDITMQ